MEVLPFVNCDMTLHEIRLVGGKVTAFKVTSKDGMSNVTPLMFSVVGRVSGFVAAVGERTFKWFLLGVYPHVCAKCLAVLGGKLAIRPMTFVRPNGVHVDVETVGCCNRCQHG